MISQGTLIDKEVAARYFTNFIVKSFKKRNFGCPLCPPRSTIILRKELIDNVT